MPDFTQDSGTPLPQQVQQQPLPDNYQNNTSAVDPFAKFVQDGINNQPKWMDSQNIRMQVPYKTRLDQTLRYTDPNLGYTPFDPNLEDEYANAHPFKTFGNNLLQSGARFLGAAAESIATIPLFFNAAAQGNFSKLYNNDFTNGIDGLLKTLDTKLPVYQTNYERDHPILKYLNILHPTAFFGATGSVINNMGFMAGAIAGSMVEDAAITAATGGAGFFPALAANASMITRLGRAGRALAEAPEDVLAASGLAKAADNIATDLPAITNPEAVLAGGTRQATRSTGENIISQSINADDVLASAKTNELKQAITNNSNYFKIRDAVKYNLALLSSGMAIGAFQAADVYHKGIDQLSQEYYELNGKAPEGQDLQDIINTSKHTADITMGANVALTYLTSRLNFGSLFKPTTQAFDEAITGSFGSIAKQSVERNIDEAGNITYNLISKTPETTIGKVLLNGQKLLSKGALATGEAAQFGAMGAITDASLDYNLKKYDAQLRGSTVNYIDSFLKGIGSQFNTAEGVSNLMLGLVMGVFGSPLIHKITASKGQLSAQEQLAKRVELLNNSTLNGTMEQHLQEAAIQTSLATDHKQAVDANDGYTARNIKFDMLYNWVTSGIKSNAYTARIEELDAVRNLTGKSFESYWHLEDNDANRQQINNFIDTLQDKAENIKNNYTKIDRLTKNPYDSKKSPQDYEAYESYKDALALHLSRSEDAQERLKGIRDTLSKLSPGLDLQHAVDITSIDGIRNIARKLNAATDAIGSEMKIAKEAGTDEATLNGMYQDHQHLSKLFSEVQQMLNNTQTDANGNILKSGFNGKEFVGVLQKLYDLHTGADFRNNKYLDDQRHTVEGNTIHINDVSSVKDSDTLANALQDLQDIYKLSQDNLATQRMYNYLRQGVGTTDYIETLKAQALANLQKFTSKDGEVKSPEEIQNEIEEDTRFAMGEPTDIEEATQKERETIRQAAKKVVTGEELTPEEEAIQQKKPSRFANEVKIQQATKQQIDERFGTPANEEQQPPVAEQPRQVKPTDVFGMFSPSSGSAPHNTNLYNAIFKDGNVFSKLTATYTVDKKPTTFSLIPKTKLFRSTFGEDINILHNSEPVGILRPPTSVWLDAEGKRSIYDLQPEEYADVTNNDPTTYKEFMDSLRAYQTAYNNLKADIQANPDQPVDYSQIKKYFDLSINTGSSAQNRYTIDQQGNKFNVIDPLGTVVKTATTKQEADKWIADNNNKLGRYDTILKDLKYKPKGTALISFVDSVVGAGRGKQAVEKSEPVIANREELTPEQAAKLQVFLDNNADFLQQNVNRYALIVPVGGEYLKKGILFARNADTTTENRTDYFTQIKSAANGTLTGDALNDAITSINDKYFLANNNRDVKQTFINTSFFEDGDFLLEVNNPSLKVFKQITIPRSEIQDVKTYGDFVNKLQSYIDAEALKDKGFANLHVELTENSLKRQIPDDAQITKLSQVENELKVATTQNVFKNYTIDFAPKGTEAKATSTEVPPPSTEPTTIQSPKVDINKPIISGINKEYSQKISDISKQFNNSLTPKEAAIKAALSKDSSLGKNIPALLSVADATQADLISYSKKAAAYNDQFNVYKQIQQQKIDNLTKTSKPVFARTKAGIKTIMQDLFNLPAEQADAVSQIYEQNAKAWLAQHPEAKIDDYYKQLGFKTQLEQPLTSPNILEQYPAVQKVIDYLKLKPKKISINKTGYVSENGSVGEKLATRIGEVIKEQNLQDLVGARWNKTDGAIEFFPIDRQGTLFQIAGVQGMKNISYKTVTEDLDLAEKLEKRGENPNDIYLATGWERGIDGKWRYDLNDKFTFNSHNLRDLDDGKPQLLSDLINNEKLFQAYPALGDITVISSRTENNSYNPSTDTITINSSELEDIKALKDSNFFTDKNVEVQPESISNGYSTLLHEIQHAIQVREGFAPGGSPEHSHTLLSLQIQEALHKKRILLSIDNANGNNKNAEKIQAVDKELGELYEKQKISPYERYRNLGGEVEARNAEQRYDFSVEKAKTTPISLTEDTLRSKQDLGSLVATQAYKANPQQQDFIDDLKAKGFKINPLNGIELINDKGGVKITKDPNSNSFVLNDIRTFTKGNGDGNALLKTVTDTADQLGVNLKLTAIDYDRQTKEGLNKKQLVNFYEKHGFQIDPTQYGFNNVKDVENYVFSKAGKDEGVQMVRPAEEQSVLFQNSQEAKGAYNKLTNTIYALINPDVTTPLHELAHSWEQHLNSDEVKQVLNWAKTDTWTRETSEKFASGFELYIAEGKAPKGLQALFDKFAQWLQNVVQKVKLLFGNDFELNTTMRDIYAKMLNSEHIKPIEEVKATEAAKPTEQAQPPVEQPKTPLTDDNIEFKENADGSSSVVITDSNGNNIPNPNTTDGTFKLQQAKDFIKEYNSKLAAEPQQAQTPQQLFEQAVKQGKLGVFAFMEPNDALKAIGQQALNLDEFGNPHKTSTPEQQHATLVKQLGDEALVNAAEQYYKSLPKPEQPVNITEPLDAEGKTDYGKVSQIQKDLQPDGFYEQQIAKGNLTVDQVKGIVKSAGLADSIVDGIKFRIENPDLIKALKEGIPKGINVTYLRSDLNKAIKDGRFGEAITNGDVSVEKAKEILNYFHIPESRFADEFDKVEQKANEAITQQLKNEPAPLTEQENAFINKLKTTTNKLTGKGTGELKDLIDNEDYAQAIQHIKEIAPTPEQAKALFNDPETYKAYNKAIGGKEEAPIEDVYTPEPTPQEQPKTADKYVAYREQGKDDTIVTKYGKLLQQNDFTSTIQDAHGNTIERVTSALKPATKEQFDSQKTHVPTAKYNVGDVVSYGADKQPYTIVDSEQRLNEDEKTYSIYYSTKEGPLISEAGIQGHHREEFKSKAFKVNIEHEQRFRVLKRISDRFEQVFPKIKTNINYFDFNAPARFNKGVVEINLGYGDQRYTRAEINAILAKGEQVPWLKREAVAHEFMHPFVAALQESNTPLYNNMVKEILANKQIMAKVDSLIESGTYKEAERNNEALAMYLGQEITKAFNKDGTLNTEYVTERKNSLMRRFVQWLQDIWDYLTGKKKIAPLDEFIKNANADTIAEKENVRRIIKDMPKLYDVYNTEHKRDIKKTVAYIKRILGSALNKDGTINPEHYEAGRENLAEELGNRSIGSKYSNTDAKVYERPAMENPVYKVTINGKERFFQRQEGMNPGDTSWNEVVKRDNFWEAPNGKAGVNGADGFLGYTKKEAIDKLASEIGQNEKQVIDPQKLDKLIDVISNYIQQKPTGRFEFIERVNTKDGVEFDQQDPDHIKVYVDPTFADQLSAPSVMLQYGAKLTDNEAAEEFNNLVQRSYYKAGSSKLLAPEINVSSINPLMRLQDISDYVVKQLADQDTQIVYTPAELQTIDSLTAYMDLTDPEAKRIRERVVARLKQLDDVANSRLNSETLKQQYTALRNLNLDATDKQFVLDYIEQGAASINLAWVKYNDIRQDLKHIDEIENPTMAKAKLNRLHKDLEVVKQLTSFYDDFNELYNRFDDEFNTDDLVRFNKATNNLNRLRNDLNETAINLAVKWFMPYVQKHNEFIVKEGYTDPRYQLTEKDLYDNLRYGTTKDTNFITYNLGATVTSRDPINAVFGNIVADMLSVNNVNIVNDTFDVNEGYAAFLKAKGISVNNSKAQEKYYKDNYLRQADILVSQFNEAKGEYEDVYIKKAALHQEYFYDQYAKDLAAEKEKYKNPRNSEESDLFKQQLLKFMQDNKNGQVEKYRNHAYTALQNDPFFKLLEKHYNTANEKYGEFKLQYGIIPQKYDRNVIERLTDIYNEAKSEGTAKDKVNTFKDKLKMRIAGIRKDQTSINLDDTLHRTVNSNLNKLKDDRNLDYNLHSSIIDFITEATNYGSLKEVQYNAENLRMLIEGNYKFSIPGRKIGKQDFEAKIRQPIQLRKAKERLAELQQLKDNGQPYDEELYKKLTDKVAKGIQPTSLWDKFAGTIKPSETNRLNEQLIGFINDAFYGESVEEAKIGSVSLNRAAHYLSMYTSINNMAFNTVAGVSNVIIGDVQMLIEGHGGKYYNKAELAKAQTDYIKNIPNYVADLHNPIKSKDTQLSFLLDAIQGEVLDEFGTRISGNIAKRMFNTSSLFFFTSVGEHQIQITGMKAMLLGRKVTTADGKTISLYDAFVKDANGRYSLRKDLTDFNQDDLQHFIRQLHSVNRSLNGNYSSLHKGVLQRKWYGTLLLKFRKYIYEAFRTRYAGEHTDFEKNTVDVGYLNYFFKDYLYKNVKNLILRQTTDFKGNNLLPHQKYAMRKAIMEVGIYAALMVTVGALFGGDEKKDLTPTQKAMLLYTLRLRNDLGMYHLSLPSEAKQQIQNPTASLTTSMAVLKTLGQLWSPNETYQQNNNGHQKGDSKLMYDLKKLTPGLSKFPVNLDNKLSYFNLVNQNVVGVTRSPNAQ